MMVIYYPLYIAEFGSEYILLNYIAEYFGKNFRVTIYEEYVLFSFLVMSLSSFDIWVMLPSKQARKHPLLFLKFC